MRCIRGMLYKISRTIFFVFFITVLVYYMLNQEVIKHIISSAITQTFNAKEYFPSREYSISVGKTIMLRSNSCKNQDIRWSVSNPDIAQIDKDGFVKGISIGNTTIKAFNINTNISSNCNINVTQSNHIRFIYSSPNIALRGSNISLIAITDTDVQDVKFEVSKGNLKWEIPHNEKTRENDTYVWVGKTVLDSCGSYNIKVNALCSGAWNSDSTGFKAGVFVSETQFKNQYSLSEKRASDECIRFIASCEGFSPKVYKDAAKIPTIGYGRTVFPYEPFYNDITKTQAYAMLIKIINNGLCCARINKLLIQNNIMFTQGQFDALVSLSYNIGSAWTSKDCSIRRTLLECGNQKNKIAIVNTPSGLNLRQEPNIGSPRKCCMSYGSTVEIIDTNKYNGCWNLVKTQKGEVGYCCADYLSTQTGLNNIKSIEMIDKDKFMSQFLEYHHVNKRCYPGLLSRRLQELDMFFYNKYSTFKYKYFADCTYPIPECIKRSIKK